MPKGKNLRGDQRLWRGDSLNPRDVDSYSARGMSFTLKGDYDEALSDFNEAILLKPKDPES